MPELVFVYGTLKEGFPNFHANKGARIPSVFFTVERFPLYLVGERCTPWMIDDPGQGERIAGELFGALLEHHHRNFLFVLRGELLEPDGRGQATGPAADDHHVVFHGFAGAVGAEDFFVGHGVQLCV